MSDDGLNETCPGCRRQFESGSLVKVMSDSSAVLCWRCVSGVYERGDIGVDVGVSVSSLIMRRAIFAIVSPVARTAFSQPVLCTGGLLAESGGGAFL